MDAYAERQALKDRQHAAAFEAWKAGLSSKQRARLKEHGIENPDLSYSANHAARDVSEMQIGFREEIADKLDTLEDILAEDFDLTPGQAQGIASWHRSVVGEESARYKAFLLARVVGALLLPGNLQLRAYALAFATGLNALNGLGSQSQAAKRILSEKGKPVTRAALSKTVRWWLRFLELNPNQHNKSNAAVRAYSAIQKEKHWRRNPARLEKLVKRIEEPKS